MRRMEGTVSQYVYYKGENMINMYLHVIGHKVFPEDQNDPEDSDDPIDEDAA